MSVECLLDTNVLVYAVSAAPEDQAKRAVSLRLLAEANFGLSAQVLQEFYVVVTRTIRRPLAPDIATALIDEYRAFPLVPTDYALIVLAVEQSIRYQISYWDAAVLAAAETLDAQVVYTEDLSHGHMYGNVQVINPYDVGI